MTGGRRGLCAPAEYRGRYPAAGYGVGRGGRPRGGGRGFAWGGGRGYGRTYWDDYIEPVSYPLPEQPTAGFAGTINGILDRLNQLAAAVADLHERFAAGSQGSSRTPEDVDEDRS
jgi:hypothetical protein